MADYSWMTRGAFAQYNNPKHSRNGMACIVEEPPYIRNCGNLVVKTTLFSSPEFCCNFIPLGAAQITLPAGMAQDLIDILTDLSQGHAIDGQTQEPVSTLSDFIEILKGAVSNE